MTIPELRGFSAVLFGHKYRLELLWALSTATGGQGICLSLLADCCGVTASVYYPPVKALVGAGMVVRSARPRPGGHVLYARTSASVWTGLRVMVEDLAVDVDVARASMTWPVRP
jgi:hypothetical protein